MLSALMEVAAGALTIVLAFGVVLVLGALINRGNRSVPERAARRVSAFPAQVDRDSGRRVEELHLLTGPPVPRYDKAHRLPVYEVECCCGVKEFSLPDIASAEAWLTVHRSISESIHRARGQA